MNWHCLRKHLQLIGVGNNAVCHGYSWEDEIVVEHLLCEYPSLGQLRLKHIGVYALDPPEVNTLKINDIRNFQKREISLEKY